MKSHNVLHFHIMGYLFQKYYQSWRFGYDNNGIMVRKVLNYNSRNIKNIPRRENKKQKTKKNQTNLSDF